MFFNENAPPPIYGVFPSSQVIEWCDILIPYFQRESVKSKQDKLSAIKTSYECNKEFCRKEWEEGKARRKWFQPKPLSWEDYADKHSCGKLRDAYFQDLTLDSVSDWSGAADQVYKYTGLRIFAKATSLVYLPKNEYVEIKLTLGSIKREQKGSGSQPDTKTSSGWDGSIQSIEFPSDDQAYTDILKNV